MSYDTFGIPPVEERPEPDELDPRSAAALLDETTRRAQREFDARPPFLTLVAAFVVLIAYGSIWLSVRHQHPYAGPTHTALAVLYGTLAAWIVLVIVVLGRAGSGIGGRAARERRISSIAFAATWIAVYVFQGALHHEGVSDAIQYGIYPAAAPIIIVGGAAATWEAAREHWQFMTAAIAAVAIACAGAFTGPATVWLVIGIGLSTIVAAYALTRFALRAA